MAERIMFRGVALSIDSDAVLEVLLAGGERKRLGDADRRALLERVRAGEHVELEFSARTFVQGKEPNRNYLRFKPGSLGKLAKSFKGQPFLRDHGQGTLDDRGGTITDSRLVELDAETSAIEMSIKAVKPWAVEGLLDGTIDRFSIGWHPTAPVTCSVHKKTIYGKDGCFCRPGTTVEDQTVEAVFGAADGVEVSAVNVPAVAEAKGVEIRAALSALDALTDAAVGREGEEDRMGKVAMILGLAAAASEDDQVAAIERLKDEAKVAGVKLAVAEERVKMTDSRLAALEAEGKAREAAALALKVEGDIERLYSTGRMLRVNGAPAAMEQHLRSVVEAIGYDQFKAMADAMPALSHVGAPMQLLTAESKDKKSVIPALENPAVRAAALAGGVTEDDILRFNGLGVLNGGV